MLSGATDINPGPGCNRVRDPDMSLGSSPVPDDTKTLRFARPPEQSFPQMPTWPHMTAQTLTSTWPSMVSGATYVKTNPGHSRTVVSDMALGNSPGLNNTRALR